MNPRGFLLGLVFLVLLSSCSRRADSATSSQPPEVGAVYSLNDGEGGFRAAKVLATEDEIVFVHLYSERWPKRPSLQAVEKISNPLSIAYSMPSFNGMQPARLQTAKVLPDELKAFEEWKQSKGEVF